LIVTLMLILFAINMIDARKREQRYVDENLAREKEMKVRIQTMEDRQYAELKAITMDYHHAITAQSQVCHDLNETMKETMEELAHCRTSREQRGAS
jgi:hypothetical protein